MNFDPPNHDGNKGRFNDFTRLHLNKKQMVYSEYPGKKTVSIQLYYCVYDKNRKQWLHKWSLQTGSLQVALRHYSQETTISMAMASIAFCMFARHIDGLKDNETSQGLPIAATSQGVKSSVANVGDLRLMSIYGGLRGHRGTPQSSNFMRFFMNQTIYFVYPH